MKKICIACGVEFTPNKYVGSKQKFCSTKCKSKVYYNKYYKHFEWKKERVCEICGKTFMPLTFNQKYCLSPCDAQIAWKINNREKYLQGAREYDKRRKQNPENVEKDRLSSKRWRKNNPDKVRYYKYKRRALEKIGNGFTEKQWNDMKFDCNYTCLKCGRKEPDIKLSIDHIISLSIGGLHEFDNIQPLCIPCNVQKQIDTTDYRKK